MKRTISRLIGYIAAGLIRGRFGFWLVMAGLSMAAFACNSGPDENRVAVDAFLEQQVEERLETYRRILYQQCRDKVLEEAGKIADSILILEARLKRDSLNKPARPLKPERPELKKLKDSLKLDPLFRDTSSTN